MRFFLSSFTADDKINDHCSRIYCRVYKHNDNGCRSVSRKAAPRNEHRVENNRYYNKMKRYPKSRAEFFRGEQKI